MDQADANTKSIENIKLEFSQALSLYDIEIKDGRIYSDFKRS